MPADRIFCADVRSQLFISSPPMPRLLGAQRDENGIREASVCQTNAKRRLDEVLTNVTVWSLFDPSGDCLLGTNSRRALCVVWLSQESLDEKAPHDCTTRIKRWETRQFSREACVGSFAIARAAMHHRLPRFESRFTNGTICQI